ncbi:hypothetical protein Mapa_003872 [Marchantia paleacea]|nr:hypothetical protein Mapa_003872 [Marchantia paleacea]
MAYHKDEAAHLQNGLSDTYLIHLQLCCSPFQTLPVKIYVLICRVIPAVVHFHRSCNKFLPPLAIGLIVSHCSIQGKI